MKNKLLTLYLDWTPNINHVGFFIAKDLGFYEDLGIRINILDPSIDEYKITPAKKVELGKSDFALCPFESVISYRTKRQAFDLIAIAAILQKDLSAIAVKDQSITSPRFLDNKTYASFGARYEDLIIRQMIKNDGGQGIINIKYPEKLGIWDTIITNKYDSTWIFLNWEGIEAKSKNISLNYFEMSDFNIPYSYSPVIVGSEKFCYDNPKLVEKFLSATRRGFLFSISNKSKALEILDKYIPDYEKEINLADALEATVGAFIYNDVWGKMNDSNLNKFINWLLKNNIIELNFSYQKLFTNNFITYP